MNNTKNRAGLLGFVAAYLLYLCYGMFQGRHEDTTMPLAVSWIFIVLFAAAAVVLGVYSLRLWKQDDSEPKEAEETDADPEAEAGDETAAEPECGDSESGESRPEEVE